MARRGENIYLRKDGRWEGRYIKGRRPDKKPIYGSVYARKYHECKEKLLHAKALYMHDNLIVKTCGAGKVSDFMIYWLNNVVRQRVKTSTFSNYVTIFDKWINPLLGDVKLYKTDQETVQCFVNNLSEHRLSAGTVRNIYNVLFAAMKKAKEYQYINMNPCLEVSLPKPDKKEVRILTMAEQKKIEQTAKSDQNGFAVLLAIYTGLRIGELCAMKWKDVDLEKGIIYVSQTIQRIKCCDQNAPTKTVLLTGSAKSNRSSRVIPLPVSMIELFKKHMQKSFGEYVFTHNGHPLEPRLLQYRFTAMLRKAGLPHINFHALRHTFATRCMELCFDIKTLSEILGHASAKLTLDRYAHSQLEHKRLAMQNLDLLFAGHA